MAVMLSFVVLDRWGQVHNAQVRHAQVRGGCFGWPVGVRPARCVHEPYLAWIMPYSAAYELTSSAQRHQSDSYASPCVHAGRLMALHRTVTCPCCHTHRCRRSGRRGCARCAPGDAEAEQEPEAEDEGREGGQDDLILVLHEKSMT